MYCEGKFDPQAAAAVGEPMAAVCQVRSAAARWKRSTALTKTLAS